jgi:hypothetical protein
MRLYRLFAVASTLIMTSLTLSCAENVSTATNDSLAVSTEKTQPPEDSIDNDQTMTEMSVRDRFRVSMRSNANPLPLNRIHSWTVHLETPDGKAIENAEIGVYGGMPMHKHGLPTKPRMTENLGGGDYTIDGIKFSMSGRWELFLIITVDGKRDKATFKIDLP